MPELPFLYWPMPHIDSITGYLENGLPIFTLSLFMSPRDIALTQDPPHSESDHTTNPQDNQRGQ